jgi:hypothetical protein
MGYQTEYSLWHDAKNELVVQEIRLALRARGIENNWLEPVKDKSGRWYYDPQGLTMKWYEHEEDMQAIAVQFPDVLFELLGEGGKWDDKWKLYLKGDKKQLTQARITVEYDPCTL